MKKAAVFAGFLVALFFGSVMTAEAGTSFSFSIGIGSAVPYDHYYYPAYPPYYYSDHYVYRYPPVYRTIVVPRYYVYGKSRSHDDHRHYRDRDRDHRRDRRAHKSNVRSRQGRWRY